MTPAIRELVPSSGPVGSLVEVRGTGFGEKGVVTFNSIVAVSLIESTDRAYQKAVDRLAADRAAGEKLVADKAAADEAAKKSEAVKASGKTAPAEKTAASDKATMDKAAAEKAKEDKAAADKAVADKAAADKAAAEKAEEDKTATLLDWDDTHIVTRVPEGATPGDVVVVVDGVSSNGSHFTVTV